MESIVAKLDAALYPAVCSVNTYLSNYILVFLLVAVGLWYSIKTRFVQVRCFGEGMRRVFGNLTLNGKKHDSGMSSFQALATAIAAQVGTGNIVGASGAILTGGPGAIFWMWVIAFFGMATIYAEATLAIKTRIKAADGTIHGGPVYYITTAFKGGFGKFLATLFAVASILALGFMGCMVQSNSIGECFQTAFGIPSWIVGVGGGAHTGLIGEQAPLGTLRHCLLDGVAKRAAHNGLRLKGVLEDHAEGGGDVPDAEDQNDEAAQQEDRRHDGNDLLRHGGQPLHASQENDTADDDQRHAHDPGGNAESGLEALADGVGLHHAAHEAQR